MVNNRGRRRISFITTSWNPFHCRSMAEDARTFENIRRHRCQMQTEMPNHSTHRAAHIHIIEFQRCRSASQEKCFAIHYSILDCWRTLVRGSITQFTVRLHKRHTSEQQ